MQYPLQQVVSNTLRLQHLPCSHPSHNFDSRLFAVVVLYQVQQGERQQFVRARGSVESDVGDQNRTVGGKHIGARPPVIARRLGRGYTFDML